LVDDLAIRHFAFDRIERFVFEENHRIRIPYRGGKQSDDVGGIGRSHDLEARDHHGPVFHALAVLGAKARTRTIGSAHDQRTLGLPVAHVAVLGELIGDIVETDRQKIGEHDLGDGFKAGHCRTHGGAEDGLFGNRRIAHAFRPEPLKQADCGLEHAARLRDILTEKNHVGIARHLLRDTAGDSVAVG
jgi:hypothetical protein